MAKIKPRIDLVNRTKLETVIPLRTPFIINIDPSDRCNFQCKFCPTGDRELMKKTAGRNYGSLDFDLYKKIFEILKDIFSFFVIHIFSFISIPLFRPEGAPAAPGPR